MGELEKSKLLKDLERGISNKVSEPILMESSISSIGSEVLGHFSV